MLSVEDAALTLCSATAARPVPAFAASLLPEPARSSVSSDAFAKGDTSYPDVTDNASQRDSVALVADLDGSSSKSVHHVRA